MSRLHSVGGPLLDDETNPSPVIIHAGRVPRGWSEVKPKEPRDPLPRALFAGELVRGDDASSVTPSAPGRPVTAA